ncbi:hypothetical protein AMJ57_02860 [Parcubacteria bacterium SG8_24]|nr:MAG: hypothetical protein AMJ57_02860 [Parcubacteria bacterium SG8_24]
MMRPAIYQRCSTPDDGRRNRGFTLMELLVVLTIFSTVVVAATDIFLLSSRSQRKIFSLERAQADARFTMEAMTREIRTGNLDYGYYDGRGTPIGLPEVELALIDSTGAAIRFHESDAGNEEACPEPQSRPCLLVTVGANDPASITPKGVRVRNLKFYISPTVDPTVFDPVSGSYAADEQPRVTIVLVLETTGTKAEERSVVYFQTTATNRSYVR